MVCADLYTGCDGLAPRRDVPDRSFYTGVKKGRTMIQSDYKYYGKKSLISRRGITAAVPALAIILTLGIFNWGAHGRTGSALVEELSVGNLHALAVGVSKYQDDRIPELNLSARDAKIFGEFLESQDHVFKNAHVKVLLNNEATREKIENYLYYELPKKVGKDDTVILFFSGHGEADPLRPRDFFFLPYDADPEHIRTRAVEMTGLEFLEGLDVKRVLLIADACYSGGFSKGRAKSVKSPVSVFLESIITTSGAAVMSSSTDGQQSWEPPGFSNSVFTFHLVEGLKGRADKDHNGVVSLQEAYDYAYRQTVSSTNGMQKPVLVHSRVVGGFPISYVGRVEPKRRIAKALFQAVLVGDTQRAQELLDMRSDIIDYRYSGNITPLMLAAKNGDAQMTQLLLRRGAETSAKDDQGLTPIMFAAKHGRLNVVKLLLDKSINLAVRDSSGNSALMTAARNGNQDIVELLLAAGANILARNRYGSTAVSIAAYRGHGHIVSLLLDAGAQVDTVDKSGRTPLTLAVRYGRRNVVSLLLKNGASIESFVGKIKDRKISNKDMGLFEAVIKGDRSRARSLVSNGAEVDSRTQSGHTPLILAAGLGYTDIAMDLIDLGADINAQTKNLSTAIKWASNNGWAETVQGLVNKGAGVYIRDKWGATPLMYASQNGYTQIVRILAEKSPLADINAKSSRGNTALTLASEKGFTEAAKILLDRGASVGAKTSDGVKDGSTPLILASANGAADLVQELIKRGAHANESRKDGATGLALAAMNGHADVVELLLKAGADPNIVNDHGASALSLAAKNGRAKVVQLLLSTGKVKTNLKDWEGMTALSWAKIGAHENVIALLEERGAD